MRGYIITAGGDMYELPELLRWRLIHAAGGEADAFEVCCAMEPEMRELMDMAVRFTAFQGGDRVFTGFVDQWEASLDGDGALLTVSGRGMAAILMDNEAESAQYSLCTPEDILREYVRPWGVESTVAAGLGNVRDFTVSAGMSQWDILRDFCRWAGGGEPRFTRSGRLLMGGGAGDRLDVSGLGTVSAVLTERRYGVISQVRVLGRSNGLESTVLNSEFIARGGCAGRVVYVPNKTGYDAMRYTGEYQIEKSMEDAYVLELELGAPLEAFAGDSVYVSVPKLGVDGWFFVRESESWADDGGCGTRLELIPEV